MTAGEKEVFGQTVQVIVLEEEFVQRKRSFRHRRQCSKEIVVQLDSVKRCIVVCEQFDGQKVQAVVASKERLQLIASLHPVGQFNQFIVAYIEMIECAWFR